ncbi:MAG: hypothetical protein ACI4SB_02740 [Acutalibacteraceae bacterium]
MKKIISVLLAMVMIFTLFAPLSSAVSDYSRVDVPWLQIYGDGEPLYNAEGEMIFHFSEILNVGSNIEKSDLYESVINVVQPFLIDGMITGNFDKYYAALEKEIGELFSEARLDKNGNAAEGQSVSQERLDMMEGFLRPENREFAFWYDWRLDPYETATNLKAYIERIKAVTGCPKVVLTSFCLGTCVVAAYIEKYGTDDFHGISFDGSVVEGAEIISEPISGKFRLNGNAINRFLADMKAQGTLDIDDFVNQSIDLLIKTGVYDTIKGTIRENLYYRLVEGVTSALALSTFFTWPMYWACVSEDDYDNALNYVFGKEGSEKRAEYAGLINKINNYNEKVRKNLHGLLKSIEDNGVNIAVISKYGYQIAPIVKSSDAIADQYASVNKSSFGATTSTVYGTLSDEYIANRIEEDKGKYISPDKQIDASTCLFPDYTWFTKGISHSNWTRGEYNLLVEVITADRQLTVDDLEASYSRFSIYDEDTNGLKPMTEENCDTYNWTANDTEDNPTSKQQWVSALIISFIRWLTGLLKILANAVLAG